MYYLSMVETAETVALMVFRKAGGLLHTQEALRRGVHPRTLYALRDRGVLETVSRGVYRLAEMPVDAHDDLAVVAARVPRATVCLVSALAFHEATTEVPHEVQIALPAGTKTPKLDHPPIRVFRFSGAALEEGVQKVKIGGVEVSVYSLPKTVVDCFKFRNKLGVNIAVEGLISAINDHGIKPREILRYARMCRMERVMRPYLEALQ